MLKKILKYLAAILIALIVTVLSIIHIFGNFHQIDKDVYRSGQLNRYNLEYYLEKYKFKTILNLRGASRSQDYKDEIELSKKYGVNHINFKISSRDFLDFNKTQQIVNILKNSPKPLLIHCEGGADRTSLASALYQYAIAKKPLDIAKKEFNIFYGHLPAIRKHVIAMDNSFDNYVRHLKEKDK